MFRPQQLLLITSLGVALACASCDIVDPDPPGKTDLIFDLRSKESIAGSLECSSVANRVVAQATDADSTFPAIMRAGDPLRDTVRTRGWDGGFRLGPVTFKGWVLDATDSLLFEGTTTQDLSRFREAVSIELHPYKDAVLETCIPTRGDSLWMNVTNRGSSRLQWTIQTRGGSATDPASACFVANPKPGDPKEGAIPCVEFFCNDTTFTLLDSKPSTTWKPPASCDARSIEDGSVRVQTVVKAPPRNSLAFSVCTMDGKGECTSRSVDFDIVPNLGKRTAARLELAK